MSLVVTDSKGNRSAPATTTAIIGNLPPTVDIGPCRLATAGESLAYAASFSDVANDNPWAYTIDWGDGSPRERSSRCSGRDRQGRTRTRYPRQYTVTLTVTDVDLGSASDQTTINVRDPGTPITLVGAGDIAECGSTVG